MALNVAIFEDDKDLADVFKEQMDARGFKVVCIYSLNSKEWPEVDVVLADYRNKIVPFEKIREYCSQEGYPLIAISGYETGYAPQLLKPFTLDELQSAILTSLMQQSKLGRIQKNHPRKKRGFFGRLAAVFTGD